jgi:HSP20 family protein
MTYFTERFFPSDLMWRNMLDNMSDFKTIMDNKINYPVDIKETENGLEFELAVPGANSTDIDIETRGDTLKITYKKPGDESEPKVNDPSNYLVRNIAKRSFSLAWKISKKYDLQNTRADMKNGLLTLKIPFVPEQEAKTVKIYV